MIMKIHPYYTTLWKIYFCYGRCNEASSVRFVGTTLRRRPVFVATTHWSRLSLTASLNPIQKQLYESVSMKQLYQSVSMKQLYQSVSMKQLHVSFFTRGAYSKLRLTYLCFCPPNDLSNDMQ